MKIVLDTNVLIAALIARGFSHQLLEHCALRHTLFTSDFILEENQRADRKVRLFLRVTAEAVNVLRSRMTVVPAQSLRILSAAIEYDDNILAAAISGKCDCIITGDKDLLVLKQHEGINIFSPRDFLINEKGGVTVANHYFWDFFLRRFAASLRRYSSLVLKIESTRRVQLDVTRARTFICSTHATLLIWVG